MNQRQQRLLASIEQAFDGVELGDGVSLHETHVIDDYGSAEERQVAREPDEKHDWRRLVNDPALLRFGGVGGLTFYDAVGLRFHLPAYLSLAVIDFERDDADLVLESLMFDLTHLSEYNMTRSAIPNGSQRRCGREVLVFLRYEHELESEESRSGHRRILGLRPG